MWCLSGETSAYYLLARREYSVGRLVGQDVVLEEASVSRLHASFVLDSDGTLHVVDKSRFGTKLNGERLAGNVKTRVSVGDVLLFGVAKKLSVNMPGTRFCPSVHASCADSHGRFAQNVDGFGDAKECGECRVDGSVVAAKSGIRSCSKRSFVLPCSAGRIGSSKRESNDSFSGLRVLFSVR